jgi:hypothetical protein
MMTVHLDKLIEELLSALKNVRDRVDHEAEAAGVDDAASAVGRVCADWKAREVLDRFRVL